MNSGAHLPERIQIRREPAALKGCRAAGPKGSKVPGFQGCKGSGSSKRSKGEKVPETLKFQQIHPYQLNLSLITNGKVQLMDLLEHAGIQKSQIIKIKFSFYR